MATTPETPPWEAILERGEGEQLVARSTERHQDALVEPMPDQLHPELLEALAGAGVEGLYAHQTDALASAYEGHTIVTTGTASGKSLAFNLPVLDTLCRERSARALYLYPTKALAQDQARALHALGLPHLRPAIYDGDTPKEERRAIRGRSNLILTNPDMLHVGVLPNHAKWGDLLANLAWVVVDEAHTYRGVFGSHVANVLRRLRRLALAYGTEPRFVLASATIANPVELAERLVGDEVRLVARDGAPRAERRIAMWNPPLVDERTGARASPLGEAADLLADLVESDTRTICFLRSRRGVELIHQFTQLRLARIAAAPTWPSWWPPTAPATRPMQRREIEQQADGRRAAGGGHHRRARAGHRRRRAGRRHLRHVPRHGGLACARCGGAPGGGAPGLALYVAGADALDQFFCRHPDQFLGRPVESAILDHESEEIFLAHLCAAAYELPLSPGDEEFLGDRWEPAARRLVSLGQLRERGGRYLPRGEGYPAARIALRSSSPDSVAVIESEGGEVIGSVETARAHGAVHDGSVYLHMGRSYLVEQLDLDNRRALVSPFSGDFYTQSKRETDTFIEEVIDRREVADCLLSFGTVNVTEQVTGYQRKRVSDHEILDLVALDMPEQHFTTQALWWEMPEQALADDFPLDVLQGSLHAAEHAQIAVLPLIAMCDRWDIGGLSTAFHSQTGRPTVFVYDGHPGGVGITRAGYEQFERLVANATALVSECPCRAAAPRACSRPSAATSTSR